MKLLDWVLALYPRGFRGRFGEDMRTALSEDYRRARSRGRVAGLFFLTTSIPHAFWFGIVEWFPRPATMRTFLTIDTRDAVRALAATPIVTMVSVLSLALGIGANTALFSILNGLVIKQLPVREPQQLVVIDRTSWPNPVWEQIRERQHDLFESAGAWSHDTQFNLAEAGQVDAVTGAYVSGGLFRTLGIDAVMGRTVAPADDVRGGGPDGLVAVISSRLWQSRFGGARDVLGRELAVNRVRFTIVGVLPPGFLGPEVGKVMDVFVPLAAEAAIRGRESYLDERDAWWLGMVARLRPGQSIDQAVAALNAVRPTIREAVIPPEASAARRAGFLNRHISIFPAATGISAPDQYGGLRARFGQPLTIILVVVVAVQLIACANIANLMLARATARRHEMSLRLALGASRLRLGCQMLVESLILAALGGLAGLAVARFGAPFLINQLGSDLGGAVTLDLSIDWRVLGFTAAASLGALVLCGLAPALGLGRIEPNDALKEQGRAVTGERRLGLRNALVVAQVGLSFALVVGAGVFVRTFANLTTTPLGFDPSNLLIVRVDAAPDWVTPENKVAFVQRVAAAVTAGQGVSRAAASRITPMSDGNTTTNVQLSGAPSLPTGQQTAWMNFVAPGWFETYGMRVLAGRDFANSDVVGSEPVAVVNQAFARRFAGGQNVIGQHVRSVVPGGVNALIVGVVNDSVYRTVRLGVVPTLYLPMYQASFRGSSFSVTAKLTSPRALVERDIAGAIGKAAPELAFRFRDYSDQLRATVIQERLVALMSGSFGALAMLLAALGVYGVTAYSVGRRRTEIAVRMALGASTRGVVRLVLGRVVTLILIGAAIGAVLSLWAARFVGTLLFGVNARDPMMLVATAAVLVAVGLLAGWLPARKVSRLDPTTALRT